MRKELNDLTPVSVLRNITIYEKEDTYFLSFSISTKHGYYYFSNGLYYDFIFSNKYL